MIDLDQLKKKFDPSPVRSLADAERRQAPLSVEPNGVTVTLSEEERVYVMRCLAVREP